MPRWTAAEYENPLAVLFVWVSALLPWEVAHATLSSPDVSVLFVRWPLFQVRRVTSRIDGASDLMFTTSIGAYQYQGATTIATGYLVWTVVSVAFLALLAFSVAFYLEEDAVTDRLDRPARLVGAALCCTGLGYLVAAAAIYRTGFAGLHVPLGALFQLAFGVLLLTNDPA
ncbi:hypothetical protein EFA46_007735 [Halarchaeum sp. CBA1220]|uniref:DUF7549 family protein n=1 Tax=Halarchaeum sp. CBA1220 TaxID=1853682 RepID=UPI000F3A895C|nr:hypothetical protein [Halarchaeum sp. CBA1220]QLC34097.1 hypothetical protein EFA46_007735 [Halarchaeum sp. CBA1220]